MELKWKTHQYTFVPADYTAGETRRIMEVRRGMLVKSVAIRVGATPFTNASITVGDTSDPNGFMTTTDATITSAGLKNGTGEYLTTKHTTGPNANGKLYTQTAIDALTYPSIDIVYATTDTPAEQGVATVIVTYCEIE